LEQIINVDIRLL